MELRLSNLNPATTSSDIVAHFVPYPISHLSQVRTVANVGKTQFKTYCFIRIEQQEQAEQAIRQYNGSSLLGQAITVSESK